MIPSGTLKYEDVANIIEAIINTEGRKKPIPGIDFEDTAQEIRLECIRILPFYEADRIGPSPYKFFQICIKNFLYNQRRGIIIPNNPPCVRCPLWNNINKICLINEVGCQKIIDYRENMATKASLISPHSLDVEILDNCHEDTIDASLLDQSIRECLDSDLLIYYDNLINGKNIPNSIKQQIQLIVTNIINNA